MTARTRSRSPTSPRSASSNARSPTAAPCSPSPALRRSSGRTASSRLNDRVRSEPKPGVAVLTFGEGVGRYRGNLEHAGFAGIEVEPAVAHLEVPLAAVLRLVRIGDALQLGVVAHLDRVAFDHEVHPFVQRVAPGHQDAVRVAGDVLGLLLLRTRAEVQGVVQPEGQQRRDVRPSVGAYRRHPEQLRIREPLPRLRPRGCGDAVVAVPGIQLGHGIVASHRALLPLRHRVIGIRPHAPAELTDEFGALCSSYFTDRHKRRGSWARSRRTSSSRSTVSSSLPTSGTSTTSTTRWAQRSDRGPRSTPGSSWVASSTTNGRPTGPTRATTCRSHRSSTTSRSTWCRTRSTRRSGTTPRSCPATSPRSSARSRKRPTATSGCPEAPRWCDGCWRTGCSTSSI